jgi:hypothetical protein
MGLDPHESKDPRYPSHTVKFHGGRVAKGRQFFVWTRRENRRRDAERRGLPHTRVGSGARAARADAERASPLSPR